MPGMKTHLRVPRVGIDQLMGPVITPRPSPENTQRADLATQLERIEELVDATEAAEPQGYLLGENPADVPLLDTFMDCELLPMDDPYGFWLSEGVEHVQDGEDVQDDPEDHEPHQHGLDGGSTAMSHALPEDVHSLPEPGQPLMPGHYGTFDVAEAAAQTGSIPLTRDPQVAAEVPSEAAAETTAETTPMPQGLGEGSETAMVGSLPLHLLSEHDVLDALHLEEEVAWHLHQQLHEEVLPITNEPVVVDHSVEDLRFRPARALDAAMRNAQFLHDSDQADRASQAAQVA